VALRQNDAVGMLTMGGVNHYCEPQVDRRGARDQDRMYDVEPTLAVPDYTAPRPR
jgi:hypothetical protein